MVRITNVQPLDDYKLLITFDNGEKKIKDMKPYLEKGVFQKLKDKEFFNSVQVAYGAISWGEEIDLCADSIYENSDLISE